jgi:hypothetical protein
MRRRRLPSRAFARPLSIGQLPSFLWELPMGDILFLALGIGAFALFAGYAAFCARV